MLYYIMELILIILAFILFAAGLLGTVIPGLPGTPLSFAGLLILHFTDRVEFSMPFLVFWAVITVVITVMDYLLPSIMTKTFGGSRYASIGAVLGLFAGLFILPPLGLIIGPFIGAFTGEVIHNLDINRKALNAAFGAFLSFIAGTGIKLIACFIMLFYAIKAMF